LDTLSEELQISRRPRDAAMFVSALTSAATIATAVQMALTFVYQEQMVRYFEREAQARRTAPQ
jgi:hypothetical protein